MKRSWFLMISGLMALFFGLNMVFAPGQMLSNMARDSADARLVLQWMGVVLSAVGFVNIAARNDSGSPALRAILAGNIVMHVAGFAIDLYQHLLGFVQASGIIMGGIVHGVLTAGFAYYLARSRR